MLAELPRLDLAVLEPEGDFLLGVLDGVGAVADVAADVLLVVSIFFLQQSILHISWFFSLYVLRRRGRFTYNGEVTTDGAGLRGERVGGTEDLAAGLDGVTALPDHGANGAAAHVGN